ncbi:PIN domain-containing protein [Mycolicibacterium helvum]|uniref:PIN domain-containing protein n=1 Tax=Mycolicibacterium helvum TaxID=1534349 RepID=A0A7I7TEX7_9MYCO|nr:PIN domain-containing protein [Mycolicibacterium helvum]BBY67774.1 hypothetical protein MHEL_60170 [Mycolicibacterium helvum]
MKRVVIDTNVLIVANRASEQADDDCELEAARTLYEAMKQHIVLIDTHTLATSEYETYCRRSGQPGVGDLFFKSLLDNIANESRVLRVEIGSAPEEIDAAIPPVLANFDPSDRKWIALHLVGSADAIVNATDSDWAQRKSDLETAGVRVLELCPHCLSDRKIRRSKSAG